MSKNRAKHKESASLEPLHAVVRARRILVVDDNQDSIETMEVLLKLSGHEVATAHDGESALEMTRDFQPEIILLDVGLPDMYGYEVAQRLRSLPENKNLVIIALTGYGQERDRERAMDAGFDYHFVKPVEFDTLESLLNELARAGADEPPKREIV